MIRRRWTGCSPRSASCGAGSPASRRTACETVAAHGARLRHPDSIVGAAGRAAGRCDRQLWVAGSLPVGCWSGTGRCTGLGMVQFVQRGGGTTGPVSGYSKEFFAAPGVALQLSAARVALIPELQYYFTGHSELTWPVHNKGLAFSARLVFLSEIRRIRR